MSEENAASGRRLTPDEIMAASLSLGVWQPPSAMLEKSEKLMDILDVENLFNQPGLNFLFDAWVGATFASIKFPSADLRLPEDRWPDIELRAAAIKQFEIVEALMPGRRRGVEYKQPAHWLHTSVSQWRAASEAIPGALNTAANIKASKRYKGGRCGLIIYLNVGDTFGVGHTEVLNAIPSSIAPAKAAFDEVYVLWNNRIY